MTRVCSVAHLTVNAIGTLLCLSAVVAFWVLGNYHAVLWCSLASTLAGTNTYLQAVYVLNKLESWYSLRDISTIRDFGMCLGVVVSGFFLYTLFEIFYYHESTLPISESKIIVAVWCFVSAKYAFTLFWFGKKYFNHLSGTRAFLEN